MNVSQYGIILFVEKYEECIAFYRDVVSLEADYAKDSLTCFRFGSAYLMVERCERSSRQEKTPVLNPTVLRFEVTNLEDATAILQSKGISVERRSFDWGHIGVFTDPDGNKCELKCEYDLHP
jgi:lactoylglutathione lyase